jgi:hypothetical protein
MATITFTDAQGAATLSNGLTGPASRFSEWTPDVDRIGDRRVSLGTGVTHEFLYRQDFVATFAIDHLPLTALPTAARFKAHAMRGETFSVNTQDMANRAYLCRLRPATEPEITMTDRTLLEYRLSVEVISADAPPVLLECRYR